MMRTYLGVLSFFSMLMFFKEGNDKLNANSDLS